MLRDWTHGGCNWNLAKGNVTVWQSANEYELTYFIFHRHNPINGKEDRKLRDTRLIRSK